MSRSTWKPIATAPSSGPMILTYDPRMKPQFAMEIRHPEGDFWRREKCGPAFWTELPEPPVTVED